MTNSIPMPNSFMQKVMFLKPI